MLKSFEKDNFKITVYGSADKPYFKAKEIATILKYKNTKDAIIRHVDKEDRVTFDKIPNFENTTPQFQKHDPIKIDPQTIFLTEFGLYSLMLSSKLPTAKEFKNWVTSEVLPSLRKTGQFVEKEVKEKLTFNLQCEADLQKAIVNYLRTKYPNIYFLASLGEMQDTEEKRIECYQKGYIKGSPDLIVFFRNKKYNGLVIEFKSPKGNGVLTPEQNHRLLQLKEQKFDIIVSNNIFEITEKICLHVNTNKVPQKISKAPKIKKPVIYRKTILDYLI